MNEILKTALKASELGRSYAFATIIESTLKGTPQKSGAKMVVLEDGTLVGTIGGGRNELAAKKECLKAIKTGKPQILVYNFFGGEGLSVCGGQIKVFIEPFIGKSKLIVCGAGHIALPLSIFGKILNFHVTIIDNRPEFLTSKRFPHVDMLIDGIASKEINRIKTDDDTYIMIAAQGNELDYDYLKFFLKKKFTYLGVIASRAKRVKFLKRLKMEGVSENKLKEIRMPAGIDIGAQTPEEIAMSIISEITSIHNSKRVGTDKFKERLKVHKDGESND